MIQLAKTFGLSRNFLKESWLLEPYPPTRPLRRNPYMDLYIEARLLSFLDKKYVTVADCGLIFDYWKENIKHCACTYLFCAIFDKTEAMTEFDKFRCWDLRNIEEFGVVILRAAKDLDWVQDNAPFRISPSRRYEFVP